MLEYLETAIVRNPLVAGADVTVLSAAEQIHGHLWQGVSTCVVIVADGGQVLGSLTEQDVIELVFQQQPIDQLTLGQFLQQKRSPSASLTIPESDLSDINTMIAHFEPPHISYLLIINTQNQLVGLLRSEALQDQQDLAHQALQQLNQELENRVLSRTQELLEREQFLQTVLDTFPLSVFWKDVNSVYLGCNQHFLRDAGLQSIEEIIGKTDYDLPWGSTEADLYRADDHNVIATQIAKLGILESQHHADGQPIWLETNKLPLHNLQGEVVGVMGTYQDISDRKATEFEQQRQLAILDNTSDLISTCAPDGTIFYRNQAFHNLLQQDDGKLVTRIQITEHHPAWALERIQQEGIPAAIEYGSWQGETAILNGKEQEIPVSQVIIAHKSKNGELEYISTIMRDISVQKQTEQELVLNQHHLKALLNNLPHIAWIKDAQSRFIAVNEPFAQACGMPTEELVGRTDYDLWPADLAQAYRDDDFQVLQSGQRQVVEERIALANGTIGWIETTKTPFRDDRQVIAGTVGIAADITDRKMMELALKDSERRYASLAAAAPVAIFRFDTPLNCIYVNERWSELTGRSMESALGYGWMDALYPGDGEKTIAEWAEFYEQTSPDSPIIHRGEGRHLHPDGSTVWVNIQVAKEFDADGNIVSYIGTLTDITDGKVAELALQDLSDRLEFALKGANIGIWEWQKIDGRLLWDDRMCALYGILPAEFSGEYADWLDRIHPDDRELVQQAGQLAHQAANESHIEFRIIHPDGAIRFIDSYAFNQRNDQGEIQKTIGLNIDITDRRLAAAQLQRSNEEMMRATRLKDEFLANMSHELRTPLNAILGMTEALQEEVFGSLNERQHKSLQTVEKSSNHLLALINDILDVAKIEAGQIKLDCQFTNITTLCQSSLALIKQQAFSKNIQLVVSIPQNLPNISIDERRIRQALINLLSNAVKFTPNGGKITLQVQQVSIQSSDETVTNLTAINDGLEINIIDTGIGIAADQIERLFQPFVQVESSLSRNYDGTGLGLALVKRLVELHGGHVRLTSELGTGSCFTISLPITKTGEISIVPEALIAINLEAIENDGKDAPVILLAEDNEASVSTFVNYLSLKGYQMIVADHGQMAIDLAQQNNPDLILMDIQMPGMDGLEAIWHIRQQPRFKDTPIIALTALAMPGDRERCLAAGASDYLSKPVKLGNLVHQINNYLKPSS